MPKKKEKRGRRTILIITKNQIILSVVAGLLLVSPLIAYVIKFRHLGISKTPSEWGPFGDFVGGIMNPLISLATLAITIVIALYLKKSDDEKSKNNLDASYQPHLVVQPMKFYGYYDAEKTPLYNYSFTTRDWGTFHKPVDSERSDLTIDLYNIGLGTAKNILVKFVFDLDKYEQNLTEIRSKAPTAIQSDLEAKILYHPRNGIEKGTLSIDSNLFQSSAFGFDIQQQNILSISHVLTVESLNKPTHIPFPGYLLELYMLHLFTYKLSGEIKNVKSSIDDFPNIELILTYNDIANNQFTKIFSLNLICTFLIFNQIPNRMEVKEYQERAAIVKQII